MPLYCRFLIYVSGTAHVTEDIANAVNNYLEGDLDINRQAGGFCDGASVMLGKHQGAMVNIKSKAPLMVVRVVWHSQTIAEGWWVW